MNVTFTGYVSFHCNHCAKMYTVESQACTFKEDMSPEAEDDQYIRYISQIDTVCASCANMLHVEFDVWEHPEAVVNYSYYNVHGAHDIQMEFNIEHYFDDEALTPEDTQFDTNTEDDIEEDHESAESDDDEQYNETLDTESYTDQYDDDD